MRRPSTAARARPRPRATSTSCPTCCAEAVKPGGHRPVFCTAPSQETGMPSRNDLADNAKKTSIGVLQACLTDGVDLYNATRQAHWNVKGPNFHALHLMFEEFYTTLATDIDDLAERIVQLGGTANGTSQTVA